jgi:hypothetical protein
VLPPDHGNRSKCTSACQNKELKLTTRKVRNHNLGSSSRRGRRVLYALGAVDSCYCLLRAQASRVERMTPPGSLIYNQT